MSMRCEQCQSVFGVLGDALNSAASTEEMLERTARIIVEEMGLKACHFRLLSRDQKVLEHVASFGLSEKFLDKGPVDAERSVAEALQGRVVAVTDCAADPRIQFPMEHAEEGIASQLTIPLATRGQVIGVMRLSTSEPRTFRNQEIEFFKVVALFCSSAITHSMFHDILEHVTDAIRTSLDLGAVLDSIARVVSEDLRAKGCTIRLLDPRSGRLEVRATYGLSQSYVDTITAQAGKIAREAVAGECIEVNDARTDPRIEHLEAVIRERFSSILYVPLMSRDQAVGVLCIYTHNPYTFSEDEKYLMTSIGEQCALAIRNAQMYETIKQRYNSVMDDFQQWFEHYQVYPPAQHGR